MHKKVSCSSSSEPTLSTLSIRAHNFAFLWPLPIWVSLCWNWVILKVPFSLFFVQFFWWVFNFNCSCDWSLGVSVLLCCINPGFQFLKEFLFVFLFLMMGCGKIGLLVIWVSSVLCLACCCGSQDDYLIYCRSTTNNSVVGRVFLVDTLSYLSTPEKNFWPILPRN